MPRILDRELYAGYISERKGLDDILFRGNVNLSQLR